MLTWKGKLVIAQEVADAMVYLHERGLVSSLFLYSCLIVPIRHHSQRPEDEQCLGNLYLVMIANR